jgi:hypothetical protein
MITHVVSFRFEDGVSWQDSRAVAAGRISQNHPRHIPEILSWSAGPNVTPRPDAYDFVVIGTFADRDALQRFQIHPDHQRGVRAWEQIGTWVVVDLEHPDQQTEDER